uniref:G-patch domain-containing protein n=1 Tax=Elaeophora elaphi TaxID=1147741 RepID=A0A0R3S150_9BILA
MFSRNIKWQNDDSRFGKKMLEKMGWKQGSGLGKYEQGDTENLQLKANVSTRGLGCDEKSDDVLAAHHDSFAAILADLNEKKEKSKVKQTKKRRKKVEPKVILNEHRKDRYLPKLSRMSEKEKCAIFGQKSQQIYVDRNTAENIQEDDVKSEPSSGNTTVSKTSINDYFANKMRKLKERRKL